MRRREKLVIYGASHNLGNMLSLFASYKIWEKIVFIIDRDERKDGKTFSISGFSFSILSLKRFQKMEDISTNYQMIIVIEQYMEVIKYLDAIPALDGLQCSIWWFPFLSAHSEKVLGRKLTFPPPEGKYIIPKIIHYCWFGGGKFPSLVEKCIQSWQKYCPDFELREWNENNYDVKSIPYTAEAYKAGMYSFVSDYARYDIISRYGGFYFDTDVELLEGIQDLCQYRGFFSFEYYNLINSGSGFAAQRGDVVINDLRDRYKNRVFCRQDQSFNLKPCSEYETEYFLEKGLRIDNSFQIYEGFLFFPCEVFSPVNQTSAVLECTENTRGIHGFACTWLPQNLYQEWDKKKKDTMVINKRFIEAWKEEKWK